MNVSFLLDKVCKQAIWSVPKLDCVTKVESAVSWRLISATLLMQSSFFEHARITDVDSKGD